MSDKIKVFGAKEHNLKSVNVEIPKEKLVVITGPSGSGKSSLALDTLYAEGRRRYVESLSSYARQFLGVSKKPQVDKVEGLCPAIAIEQKTVGFNPRSTVGTITEIYDYLRVLFARLGEIFCPNCHKPVKQESPEGIASSLLAKHDGDHIYVAGQIANARKGEFLSELREYFAKGYDSFIIDEKFFKFKEMSDISSLKLSKTHKHTINVIVDKIVVSKNNADFLFSSVKTAFSLGRSVCVIVFPEKNFASENYVASQVCLDCVLSFAELEPRLFSFNSPQGACKNCNGLGMQFSWHSSHITNDEDLDEMGFVECNVCFGARLNKEALSVKVEGKNIYEICKLSVSNLKKFFDTLSFSSDKKQIADRLLSEIISRINFLINVGLDYLSLSRTASTLSGGESQRIRLSTQLGAALSGVLYVLDEPSIGLHQRDNDKLIATLQKLRDLGNSVIVVEHDLDTILAADHVIDMGPGSGVHGGEVVAQGSVEDLVKNKNSVTGPFVSGEQKVMLPRYRRKAKKFLEIKGATKNNLKNVDVSIPLETLVAVTGVSGSGKSSLITQAFASALQNYFHRGFCVSEGIDDITGIENIKNMVFVDQKSIGKTPRSNPATYIGIFDDIRNLFSRLPDSKLRGYGPGHFSFNVAGGRCNECSGDGVIKISMQFLEDVVVVCKSCKGRRYDQFVLEVKYKNKNIWDILEMSVEEALDFFEDIPAIQKRLSLMQDVGLGYIKLGQACNTISGGEAQRIKLVNELAKRGSDTLYILDEPTTGLHLQDIQKLLTTITRLVDKGNTVVVIEHNLDVIKCADYIIDMGPEGGDGGGNVVAFGTPEEVAKSKNSFTAQYLKKYLK